MREAPGARDFPWWLVAAAGLGLWAYAATLADPVTRQILVTLLKGVRITIVVTVVAFAGATILGLGIAAASLSRHIVLRQAARFYVEIIRGVPMLVLLLYVAFVVAPGMVAGWNWVAAWLGLEPVRTRDFSLLWRAVMALTIGYSAFISEVFRAGIQAVGTGQVEAAEALGLRAWPRFRHVVFPQAFRMILPPLGNDFVAMIKDSSLVSVLGVLDVTQLGKVTAAANFRYFETYNVVTLIYLTLTVTLSILLRRLEERLRTGKGEVPGPR